MRPLMDMETPGDGQFTVLGPCPGCSIWTLEYQHAVVTEWPSADAFFATIEQALVDHLAECPGLQEIVKALNVSI